MSYKPEVVADRSGSWNGNGLRFATRDEAEAYVLDLSCRWTLVTQTRVIESDDAVNYRWTGSRAEPIPVTDTRGELSAAEVRSLISEGSVVGKIQK
jgi:hypothetical protein